MASKKKESEGIALLSMYYDEEDEEMEDVHEDDDNVRDEDMGNFDRVSSDIIEEPTTSLLHSHNSIPMEDSSPKEDRVLTPTPQHQAPVASPPPPPSEELPPPLPPTFDVQKSKRQSLTIVDYGNDEIAMSPEAEEGEIMETGYVSLGEDLQNANSDFQGITPPVAVQNPTPNIQGTPPQPPEQQALLPSDSCMVISVNVESETTVVKETVTISVEMQKDVDPLDNFLPPPPKTMCSEELQEKINKFLALKRLGKSFNAEVRNRKDYRNPDFLLHAVRYQDIDQIGSCFDKDVFDPHGYDKSDYYDEIEADMKREMERKEQERKRNQKLEFVGGGTQAGGLAVAQRNSIQNPVLPTVASAGFHSHPTAADSMPRDGRQNKKSKWDKVDGDRKNPMHMGGQDALPTSAAHAALLSAANVGAGYTAFAQQKRREAEEKRSSDKRRS